MLLLLVVFVFTGLLFVGLAVPLVLRRVPPNAFYGLRVPATFAHEGVWYEANARSGWDLLWLGVALVTLALVLPILDVDRIAYTLLWCGAAAVGALSMTVVGWRRANRLLRERSS